jgi:hypothetical protein
MSNSPPSFLEYPWRWQMSSGRQRLITDGGGSMVVLAGAYTSPIWTRDPQTGTMRSIDASDEVAKIIASAPEIRRHSRSLIHGINIGLFRIEADGDEKIADEVLTSLREALARSGAV